MDQKKCSGCRHYYITWDTSKPWGCRAFGFKSSNPPYLVVRKTSGAPCALYEPREKPVKKGPRNHVDDV